MLRKRSGRGAPGDPSDPTAETDCAHVTMESMGHSFRVFGGHVTNKTESMKSHVRVTKPYNNISTKLTPGFQGCVPAWLFLRSIV